MSNNCLILLNHWVDSSTTSRERRKLHRINGQIDRTMCLGVSLCGRDFSSIFQSGCMNCTSGTCSKLPTGWTCFMFTLTTIIIFVGIRSSLFPWRNFGSYSIWMHLVFHSSVAGLCKCLF
jgi:hypothetical protein